MKKRTITAKDLDGFGAALRSDEKSSNTLQKYLRDVRAFSHFAEERSIDKPLVLEYKASLEKSYALKSANSMLAAINSFFKYMGWLELCVKQFKLQYDAFCSEERELSRGEYFALIRAAEQKSNRRLSLIIQTICGTGIRVSELQYITVAAVRCGEVTVSCKGKTRRVFIVPELCKKLHKYIKDRKITSGSVFITKFGKPVSRCNIWKEMKALCEAAGVNPKKVFPHNLRHLFARTFYSIEKDIARLADILGHTSINTTRIYTVSSGAEHRKRLQCMRLII